MATQKILEASRALASTKWATSNDPDRNKRLLSRKWLVSIGTIGAVIGCAIGDIPLEPAECAAMVVPAIAYVLGESWVDGRQTRNNPRSE